MLTPGDIDPESVLTPGVIDPVSVNPSVNAWRYRSRVSAKTRVSTL